MMEPRKTRATDSSPVVMHLHADDCSASAGAKYLRSLGIHVVDADLNGLSHDMTVSANEVPVLIIGQEILNWPLSMASLAALIAEKVEDRLVIVMTTRRLTFAERSRLTTLGKVRIVSVTEDQTRLRDMIRDWMRDLAMTGYRVLLVEDSQTDAYIAIKYMQTVGLEVKHIKTPEHVLDAIDSFQPDLIISDLHMDQSSGDEMTAIIRQEREATMPIIFLSAEGDAQRQMMAIAAGANGFIKKPLRQAPFLELIKSTIRRSVAIESRMRRDALTNLFNRAQVFARLTRLTEVAGDTTLAIIDIDHFKQVNDTHGHPVGDQVICGLARVLEQSVRSTDFVGRLGGEEFAVIMPKCSTDNAVPVLNRLREAFASVVFTNEQGSPFSCTLSAGIALLGSDVQASYKNADLALYEAKERGRNRVAVTPPVKE